MSTTPHPIVPEEIMAHLDGELSADRAQSVSAHLESCAACQELVSSLRNTSRSLSSWAVAPAPVNAKVAERLFADAASASPKLSDSPRLGLHIFPHRHWKLLTASSVIAVLLIMTIGFRETRLAPSSPSTIVDMARIAEVAHQRQEPTSSGDSMVAARALMQEKEVTSQTGNSPDKAIREVSKLKQVAAAQSAMATQKPGLMIARTVSLSIVTKDFDASRASLDAILARHNGYAADLNVATPQGAARMLQASLRVPAPQLPSALVQIKALGRAEAENQNGEEVTQQHADLLARLKNSRETEQRLQAILTQRTGKISDVLEVEQEIARVRGEIEQMEAEQKTLEHRVDFATIDLKLSEEYKAKLDSPAPAVSTLIHNAAVNGYRNVADTLLSIVLFFAEYGPVLTFWLLLFSVPAWLVWRRWRHAVAA